MCKLGLGAPPDEKAGLRVSLLTTVEREGLTLSSVVRPARMDGWISSRSRMKGWKATE